MSERYGHCQDTRMSARLLPGSSWQPPRYNKRSLYKGPTLPRRPVQAQGLPPLSTGYVQEIIDQLISGVLPVVLWLSGHRALGLKHQKRAQGAATDSGQHSSEAIRSASRAETSCGRNELEGAHSSHKRAGELLCARRRAGTVGRRDAAGHAIASVVARAACREQRCA